MRVVYHPLVQRDVNAILKYYDGVSFRLDNNSPMTGWTNLAVPLKFGVVILSKIILLKVLLGFGFGMVILALL